MKTFNLGSVVCTRAVSDLMDCDVDFHRFVNTAFRRYMSGDWGDTCEEDAKLNDAALVDGKRILSVYIQESLDRTIWIITESDRSVTTVLFPWEY